MSQTTKDQITWEKTIKKVLGKDSPCKICIVRATCTKSFSYKSACEELAKALQNKIDQRNLKNED